MIFLQEIIQSTWRQIYEKIIYDVKHYSPAQFSDNVILINGFSKAYSMTGFRIAYISNGKVMLVSAGSPECIKGDSDSGNDEDIKLLNTIIQY